jgi:membrane dipeptidase
VKGFPIGPIALVIVLLALCALLFGLLSAVVLLIVLVVFLLLLDPLAAFLEKRMNRILPHEPYAVSPEAREKHASLTVMDWHSDSLLWNRDLLKRSSYGHVDIPRLREGNVAVQVLTAVTKSPRGQNYDRNTAGSDNITLLALVERWPLSTLRSLKERALHQARRLHDFERAAPDQLRILRTRRNLAEVLSARADGAPGLVGTLLGVEGAHALDGRLESIEVLYEAGYRLMGLHHFFDNELGGSLHGLSGEGLSDFGRTVVRRLEELQLIIDVAHSSPAVVDDVLEMTERPVVLSHTGMHGLCPNARNLKDEQMERLARKGGLIGIGYWDAIGDIAPDGVVKSLRYAINLVGEDHVSLGSDFDGTVTTTFDTSELAVLTQKMMDSGFSDAEIEKVMGGNAINFLKTYLPD